MILRSFSPSFLNGNHNQEIPFRDDSKNHRFHWNSVFNLLRVKKNIWVIKSVDTFCDFIANSSCFDWPTKAPKTIYFSYKFRFFLCSLIIIFFSISIQKFETKSPKMKSVSAIVAFISIYIVFAASHPQGSAGCGPDGCYSSGGSSGSGSGTGAYCGINGCGRGVIPTATISRKSSWHTNCATNLCFFFLLSIKQRWFWCGLWPKWLWTCEK